VRSKEFAVYINGSKWIFDVYKRTDTSSTNFVYGWFLKEYIAANHEYTKEPEEFEPPFTMESGEYFLTEAGATNNLKSCLKKMEIQI
jgi:hypothetical protein